MSSSRSHPAALLACALLAHAVSAAAEPAEPAAHPAVQAAPVPTDAPPAAPAAVDATSGVSPAPADGADDAAAAAASADAARRERDAAARAARREKEAGVARGQRRVAAIEDEYGSFDRRLVDALTELGIAQHEVGRNTEALGTLERAQHISRVDDGLYNLDQIKVIDALARVLTALDRGLDAVRAKEYAVFLVRRARGTGSIELVDQLYDLAAWYENAGQVFGARRAYEEATRIVEQAAPGDSPQRAEALRRLARSYRLERFPEQTPREPQPGLDVDYGVPPTFNGDARRVMTVNRFGPGENALKEALRVYLQQQPPATREIVATLLELGDWYLMFDRTDLALLAYREARQQAAPLPALQQTLLTEPVQVYFRAPVKPLRPDVDAVEAFTGYVDVAFDVNERGEVRNISAAAVRPEGMRPDNVLRAFRQARYRPALDAAGNPIASTGLHFRYEFPVYDVRDPG